ncbi:MAG TPA: FAD binding domain-containing protein, partial [Hyphomicrobiaceae bacterium]|nr:FAD binding domain-containing protein [Hyphomicrobiaceae bacterium]
MAVSEGADSYFRPATLAEALGVRAAGAAIIAGATDVYPALVPGIGRDLRPFGRGARASLDITGLAELRGIEERDGLWRIGAATTWTEIADARLPPAFACLRLAAREVGGRQIQNRGTIGGNLVNASPAADGFPPLLALDAEVELQRRGHVRRLPLSRFVSGPRTTALDPDEILTAILIRQSQRPARSHFLKLGARRYLVISIAMVAA